MSVPFFFDPATLDHLAEARHAAYASAAPFPHQVIDEFLPQAQAEQPLAEFPEAGDITWDHAVHVHSKKLYCSDETRMGPGTRHIFAQFNSATFLVFLERLTRIAGLIPDPHFAGGGLHRIERGGFLDVHADFNFYDRLGLERRLNLLLYLNRGWKEEYGGHLELWDRTMSHCAKRILPAFNRCVLFSTTDESFHGHPDPLACPSGEARKSLACTTTRTAVRGRPRRRRTLRSIAHGQGSPDGRVQAWAGPSAGGCRRP